MAAGELEYPKQATLKGEAEVGMDGMEAGMEKTTKLRRLVCSLCRREDRCPILTTTSLLAGEKSGEGE